MFFANTESVLHNKFPYGMAKDRRKHLSRWGEFSFPIVDEAKNYMKFIVLEKIYIIIFNILLN